MSIPVPGKVAVLLAALVVVPVIIIEMTELCPWASRKLLQWAARRCFAADPRRERYAEEWLADLDEVPDKLTKFVHTLGVLVFTAVPLWARRRWERSRIAGWLETSGLRPAPDGVNAGTVAVLARAGVLALVLAVTGLVAVQTVQSALRTHQGPAAPSGAAAVRMPGSPASTWVTRAVISAASGRGAEVAYLQTGWQVQLDTRVIGIPVGTRCRVYIISSDGTRHLVSTWTTNSQENNVWYSGGIALTASQIKSFEVTTGTLTPPVFITPH